MDLRLRRWVFAQRRSFYAVQTGRRGQKCRRKIKFDGAASKEYFRAEQNILGSAVAHEAGKRKKQNSS